MARADFAIYEAMAWTEADELFLAARRKSHIRWRDEALRFKKLGGDSVRFFGAWEKSLLQSIRACEIGLKFLRGETAALVSPVELQGAVWHEMGCAEMRIPVEETA